MSEATANWRDPNHYYPCSPEIYVGDRIVMVVRERPHANAELQDRLVILECTETGWNSSEEIYQSYSPQDGIAWTTEKDLIRAALAKAGETK